MPAEKSFGRAEARTTARMEPSSEIASKVRPSSVHMLREHSMLVNLLENSHYLLNSRFMERVYRVTTTEVEG